MNDEDANMLGVFNQGILRRCMNSNEAEGSDFLAGNSSEMHEF